MEQPEKCLLKGSQMWLIFLKHNNCNAHLGPKDVRKFCRLDGETKKLLHLAVEKFGLSARVYDRILKVALTTADIDDSEDIKTEYISEAIQYRSLHRKFWLHA